MEFSWGQVGKWVFSPKAALGSGLLCCSFQHPMHGMDFRSVAVGAICVMSIHCYHSKWCYLGLPNTSAKLSATCCYKASTSLVSATSAM